MTEPEIVMVSHQRMFLVVACLVRGGGGNGGTGVFLSSGTMLMNSVLMNSGTIRGGNGGTGGSGSPTGTAGAGGVGVIGTGNDYVINSGTISPGAGQPNAIEFFNGSNTLELRPDFVIEGLVVASGVTTHTQ